MNVLKAPVAVLLGLILFLSLAIFGLALTTKMTALNADFIASRLNEFSISSLIPELEIRQLAETPELTDAIEDFIAQHEPEIKERMGSAIHNIYDYLLDKSPVLDLGATLRATILDPELAIGLVDGLDMAPLLEKFLGEQIPKEEGTQDFPIEDYLKDVARELEPWLKEQVITFLPPIYDYVLDESQSLDLVISLEPAKQSLRDILRQAFLESPPPELAGLPPAELEREFNTLFDEFSRQIPATFTIDDSLLDLDELKRELSKALGDAEEALGEARQYIGYFQRGFGWLVGFMLLLILGIILIYREFRGSSRILGIVFLTYGIASLIAVFIARGLAKPPIAQLDVPPSVQAWLTQLINSSLTPLLILVIVLMVVGATLIAVSFIYRSRQQPE